MPGELKPLVRGWQKMPVARGSGITMWQRERDGDEVVAVCAGMGAAAARRAFIAAEFAGSLDVVLSVGLGRGVDGGGRAGRVLFESLRSSTHRPASGSRWMASGRRGWSPRCKSPTRGRSNGLRRVMEHCWSIWRRRQSRGWRRFAGFRVHCFKAISDGVEAELPDLNRYIDIDGKLRLAAFLAYVAVRPQYWASLLAAGAQ